MTKADSAVLHDLAPEGVLTVAINFGNPVLAQRGGDGQPQGVSVALAKALAEELGVALDMVTFDAAGKVFAALAERRWTVAFLAIDPIREQEIAFSAPYVIIEGTYLVNASATFQSVDELDRPGHRIAVGRGAAYDLYLTRTLQHAEIVRADTSEAAVELFLHEQLDAAAGVRQPLQQVAFSNAQLRVLDGHFTTIRQAMAVPKDCVAGAAFVRAFVERQKANGLIADGLRASGQWEVTVAPREP